MGSGTRVSSVGMCPSVRSLASQNFKIQGFSLKGSQLWVSMLRYGINYHSYHMYFILI